MRSVPHYLATGLLAATLLATRGAARADETDDLKKAAPQITHAEPLAVMPGAKVTLHLRGTNLDEASAIRFPEAKDGKAAPQAVIKSKGAATPPKPFEAKTFGNSQVEVELTLPADIPVGPLSFIVVTPKGESKPYALTVVEAGSLVDEKEPNDGFRQAQDVEPGKVVQGAIASEGDVDVFRIPGKKGKALIVEVNAARKGSPLDALLTLYDEHGHLLATSDDNEPGSDPVLRFTPAADGDFYLALTDANNVGSNVHAYQLLVKREGPRPTTQPATTQSTSH